MRLSGLRLFQSTLLLCDNNAKLLHFRQQRCIFLPRTVLRLLYLGTRSLHRAVFINSVTTGVKRRRHGRVATTQNAGSAKSLFYLAPVSPER